LKGKADRVLARDSKADAVVATDTEKPLAHFTQRRQKHDENIDGGSRVSRRGRLVV